MQDVSSFFVGFTCGAVLMRIGLGSLGDRLGHQRVSLVAIALYGVTAFSMVALRPELFWAYGLAFGCCHGTLYPTLNALVLQQASSDYRGRAMTWYNGAFNVGTAASNLAWGSLAAGLGYPWVYFGAATLAWLGAIVLVKPIVAMGREG
jgi:MFS family permease